MYWSWQFAVEKMSYLILWYNLYLNNSLIFCLFNLQNENVDDIGHGRLCNLKKTDYWEHIHNTGEILRNVWLLTMDPKIYYYDLTCTKDVFAWYKRVYIFFVGLRYLYLSSYVTDHLVNIQYLEREIPMITGDKK